MGLASSTNGDFRPSPASTDIRQNGGEVVDLQVQAINGNMYPVSIEASARLVELYEAVARALDVAPWMLRLTAGTSVLDVSSDGDRTLEALGIKEVTRRRSHLEQCPASQGPKPSLRASPAVVRFRDSLVQETDVIALRCTGCFLENAGISGYNGDYFCSVLQVCQAGWNAVEIKFSAWGDGSLGKLQDPSTSRLSFLDSKRELKSVRPKSVTLEVDESADDRSAHKQGVMTFEGVPTHGQVWFVYGATGYDKLALNLSDGRE
ncbi:hypothetical protein AK812_SmicGene42265 [Symbiodinium microadriaticum]|uniref:Uncharacterized protein n=1 Tax=Symbiodinium microadriaticum TaxID=2951 RepID=A0A1Q9C413_SYMMI|nr:hypothetical protein AK812_SmicGene42265 [Symbiodinium microadriaticum]